MRFFLFGWNPKSKEYGFKKHAIRVRQTEAGETPSGSWIIGTRKDLPTGSRFFMMRRGTHCGMIGAGYTTSLIDRSCVDFRWERVLELEHRISTDELAQEFPEYSWKNLQGSGHELPEHIGVAVEEFWQRHLRGLNAAIPAEEVRTKARLWEGATKKVLVNSYERSATARAMCIEHYGSQCCVCGFDFGLFYGPQSDGFIHVHHETPLGCIKERYEVDPIEDLRPVCPNCHAMLHAERPAQLDVQQLKRRIAARRRDTADGSCFVRSDSGR